jgi:hypothetical protein
VVKGLSRSAAEAVARLEAREFGAGAVARALACWQRSVQGPARGLRFRDDDCGHLECCRTHLAARDLLESAVMRLPARAARELRALVAPYDGIFESRSVADPGVPVSEWWWQRRFVP